MCQGEGCEARDRCYRFTAKPNSKWQSYFSTPLEKNIVWELPNAQGTVVGCSEFYWYGKGSPSFKRQPKEKSNLTISDLRNNTGEEDGPVLWNNIRRELKKIQE
jgi:hypothetical protein